MTPSSAISRAQWSATPAILRALVRELGVAKTARVLGHMVFARARGEPFGVLGPPVDERDRLSRAQARDLVLLDRAAARVADPDTALRVARKATLVGGTAFLDRMIPPLPEGRAAEAARQRADRFFNAEGEARSRGDDAFSFTVTRCRFVELLGAVGSPHLAPLFCEVDAHYFSRSDQPVQLRRTKTLATGGDACDFEFTAR